MRRSSTFHQPGSVRVFSVCYSTDLPRHFPKLREQDLPWSNRQPGLGADRLFDEKDRQTTIRVLHELLKIIPAESGSIQSCRNPVQTPLWMHGLHSSRRITLGLSFCCRRRSHYWTKRKQAGKTNVLVCSNQSIVYAFPPSVIHLKKESLVCFQWQEVYDAIFWYGMNLVQAKGLVRSQTRQTRSCTTRRHLNLNLSRESRYKISLRGRSGGSTDTTEAKIFQSIDVAREHSSQSLGSARGDPSPTRHGQT